MRYTRTLVLLLVTSLVIGVAPAASGAPHNVKATFSVDEDYVVFPDMPGGPAAIAEKCGSDWPGWIFGGGGEGTLTVGREIYEDAAFEFEHCSRWVAFDPERPTGRQVGKSAMGVLTITTENESTLELEYSGTWVLEGEIPGFTADLHYSYTLVEGTGDFGDASKGHGQLSMTVGPIPGAGSLAGSLK